MYLQLLGTWWVSDLMPAMHLSAHVSVTWLTGCLLSRICPWQPVFEDQYYWGCGKNPDWFEVVCALGLDISWPTLTGRFCFVFGLLNVTRWIVTCVYIEFLFEVTRVEIWQIQMYLRPFVRSVNWMKRSKMHVEFPYLLCDNPFSLFTKVFLEHGTFYWIKYILIFMIYTVLFALFPG